LRYTNAKVRENYSRRFSIRFPNEELPAARPAQTTPLYDTMVAQNAVMGDSWGLETPLWFAPKGSEPKDIVSFRRSNDFGPIGEEVRAVRTSVGVTEIANFAKYEVTGPGAEAFLNRLMTNRMAKVGRIVLTPMLNEFGKLIGDFTIAHAGEERFMIWGSSAAQKYHMRWFEKHLPKDGSVRIHRFDMTLVGLSIAGPKAQALLQKLVDVDVSTKAFRFMDFREMAVGGAPCMVNRVTYTGDLGYEIWMQPAYQRLVYHAIKEAGAEFGIVDFGMRALLSMRLEKNFPTWFRELRPIYGPFEGGMDRFIRLEKNDFIGRDAAAKELEALKSGESPKLKRVSFVVDALDADVMGDEPIWAKVSTDYGTVEKPHGYGAPRFDVKGKEIRVSAADEGASSIRGIVDGDWRVVGWVTSGGYAHTVQKSMAQGYVPAALADNESDGVFEIEILGQRRPARINLQPLFDPAGEKMRG
ncbi:MAG: glycine cleavage system protein T, partial [Mesorhizobium sp.]|nr:glycine cleavage system protein T [Mesorhizobium sp.]